MNYREIVSVTGAAGLYQLVGSKGDGALVRQLGDNVVRFMPGRKHSVTQLETIEIYTVDDNLPLHRIFERMRDSKTARPDQKSAGSNDIKEYFKTVVPELDEDRVYISDMKKILKWYEILETNSMLEFPAATPESGEESDGAPVAAEETVAETKTESAEEAPAKKAPRKKKATEPGEGGAGEEAAAPKKKATAKKKDA